MRGQYPAKNWGHFVRNLHSKLIFENRKYRTPEINSLIPLICKQAKAFKGGQNKKHAKNSVLSLEVDPERIELSSKQLINELSTCLFCF